jgi:hypothetical protein
MMISNDDSNVLFWSNFRSAQRSKLPVKSDFFETLEEYYSEQQSNYFNEFRTSLNKKIPANSIRFYNDILKKTNLVASSVLRRTKPSPFVIKNLKNSFGFKLDSSTTVSDIIKLDVFAKVTVAQDIYPKVLLKGIDQKILSKSKMYENTLHFFFHRPQQSEFLIFHELVVGYLVNIALKKGRIPKKLLWSDIQNDYWATSAFVLQKLSQVVGIELPDLVKLHFEKPSVIRKRFSERIKDLFLAASHISWYFDYINRNFKPQSASATLSEVYVFFVQASLDKLEKNPKLKLINNAGDLIDTFVHDEVISYYSQRDRDFGDADAAILLSQLSERLWVK